MSSCRHILTTGRRCQANAMLDKAFCYFHYNINQHHRALNPPVTKQYLAERGITREELSHPAIARSEGFLLNRPTMFNFPPLEDADAIQLAISMVVTALGEYRLEPKRGATILFGLQVANSNIQIKRPNPDSDPVHEITTDEEGREVAPDAEDSKVAPDSPPSSTENLGPLR